MWYNNGGERIFPVRAHINPRMNIFKIKVRELGFKREIFKSTVQVYLNVLPLLRFILG